MSEPLATVVIPTHRRGRELRAAVDSALAQTVTDSEVLVVDDGSPEPPRLPAHPRLRLLRLPENRGACHARNAGLAAARGRWFTVVDDDDLLTPDHLEVALTALETATLPAPVATLSGVAVVAGGAVVEERMPPTLPRGSAYSLEAPQPGTSFAVRSTLVVERAVLAAVGGWDVQFRSLQHTDLLLRLNPVCSLLGVPVVTYRRHRHAGPRVSGDPRVREESLHRLLDVHAALLAARPARHADLLFQQALRLWLGGRRRAGLVTWTRAVRRHPPRAARRTGRALVDRRRALAAAREDA